MSDSAKDPGANSLPARLLAGLQRCEKLLLGAAFAVLVLVVFADVVSRELYGAGLYWASRTGVWANVIVVMTGFGLASAGGAHLRPQFADNWLPERWSPLLATLQHLLMALFCLALGLLAGRVVLGSFQLGELSIDLFLPIWPVQLFLPLAFMAAFLRHFLYACYPALRPIEEGSAIFAPTVGSK
jgi:TRAP-type C4-dicarboxylate transport system permease small subunit